MYIKAVEVFCFLVTRQVCVRCMPRLLSLVYRGGSKPDITLRLRRFQATSHLQKIPLPTFVFGNFEEHF